MRKNIIQSMSLFPYIKFWRLGGKTEISSTFGGIISILIYLFIGSLYTYQIIQLTKKVVITSTSSSTTASQNDVVTANFVNSNITSSQNDSLTYPFMLAFDFDSNLSITAGFIGYTFFNSITLENCTKKHFSVLPNIDLLY